MFHDEVEFYLESGKGGDGSASFRREKYIPKGGPDGGDGGKGGDVYIEVNDQTHGLNHLASVRQLKAENGVPGQGRKLYGRAGEDLVVKVPLGTRIYRQVEDNWRLVKDLTNPQQRLKLLTGGQGGLGNVHFATATLQAPKFAQPGEPAQRAKFKFELQLIADVGIIGLPNAGKSTFLAAISDAKPKIADYPFTTLSPVLGVVIHKNKRIIFADIPGLIEGAAQGKGLGHTFLKHIQRTKILIHFIDSLSDNYARDYKIIRGELIEFDLKLAEKKEVVVVTKDEMITDAMQSDFHNKLKELKLSLRPPSILFPNESISALTKHNIEHLLSVITTNI